MNQATNNFLAVVLGLAAVLLAGASTGMKIEEPLKLEGFLGLAGLASTLKVSMPGVKGNYSMNVPVLLAAVPEPSLAELLPGAVAAVTQSHWRASRRRALTNLSFNASKLVPRAGAAFTQDSELLD